MVWVVKLFRFSPAPASAARRAVLGGANQAVEVSRGGQLGGGKRNLERGRGDESGARECVYRRGGVAAERAGPVVVGAGVKVRLRPHPVKGDEQKADQRQHPHL